MTSASESIASVKPMFGGSFQWCFDIATSRWLVVGQFRKLDRQLTFRVGHGESTEQSILEFMPNWERLAPVALAAEEPIAQLVIDTAFALLVLPEPGGDLLLELGSA